MTGRKTTNYGEDTPDHRKDFLADLRYVLLVRFLDFDNVELQYLNAVVDSRHFLLLLFRVLLHVSN